MEKAVTQNFCWLAGVVIPRRSIEDAETSLPSLFREFVVRGPVEAACVELPRRLFGLFGA